MFWIIILHLIFITGEFRIHIKTCKFIQEDVEGYE